MRESKLKEAPFAGKVLLVPGMDSGGARLLAAVFRSAGAKARSISSDAKSLELASKHSNGEECLPARLTMGDFLREIQSEEFSPSSYAFFMPLANGPCRFGQYAPYMRMLLDKMGYGDVEIISPSCEDGYGELAEHSPSLLRRCWWAVLASDILRKMLHRVRPYECNPGDADRCFERSIELLERIFEERSYSTGGLFKALLDAMVDIRRDYVHGVRASFERPRPLIAVVGEIYCRLNEFANNSVIRQIEDLGGECWLSDVAEWFWYSNFEDGRNLRYAGKSFSLVALKNWIKAFVQHRDEKALYAIFSAEFVGREEAPNTEHLFDLAAPYLSRNSALGETILSVGKVAYAYRKGADGAVDISPFSCMNGIISESIYPRLSKDCGDFPIKSFYFDGLNTTSLERGLPIFMEMARGYMSKKCSAKVS